MDQQLTSPAPSNGKPISKGEDNDLRRLQNHKHRQVCPFLLFIGTYGVMVGFAKPDEGSSEERLDEDVRLAADAAAGDQAARRRLVERVFDRVHNALSYLSSCGADAEDLTQLALIQILRSAGNFRGDCSLERWADRIAFRTATKQFDKRKRRDGLTSKTFVYVDRELPVDEFAARRRAEARLAELLADLSHQNRTALVLHYLYGYSIAEISDIAGCPLNTVRGRLRQGRKLLKRKVLDDPVLSEWIEREFKRREP